MVRVILLFMALLSVNATFAQDAKKHAQIVRSLQQQTNRHTPAMRTTSGVSTERVIAQSITDHSLGTLSDSINLNYGINRGSTYDYNTMLYPYNYPYSTSPMFNYAGVFTKPQVLFDTMMHWATDPNTLVYGYYETDYAKYDANRNTTSYAQVFVDSSFEPNMLYANTFSSTNDITMGNWFNWIGGLADSAFRQYFTYDSLGLLAEDSVYEYHMGVWDIVSKTYYTYNDLDELIQIDNYANDTDTSLALPLIEQLKYVNTYDASYRLRTVASSFFDGTALTPYIRDTFGYSGTYTYHNSWKEYQYDPINAYWAPIFNMSKLVNGLGLPDTVYIQGFDSLMNAWVPQTMDVISYDAANNPDTLQDYEYNFTAYPSTPSFTTVYYYETYLLTLANNTVAAANDQVKVYPNPATNTLNITQLGVPTGTMVTMTLMNVSGQMMSREQLPWTGSAQVSVATLVPGVYELVIQDGKGNMLHRQSVVKQ